jgi:hypothetical protein
MTQTPLSACENIVIELSKSSFHNKNLGYKFNLLVIFLCVMFFAHTNIVIQLEFFFVAGKFKPCYSISLMKTNVEM